MLRWHSWPGDLTDVLPGTMIGGMMDQSLDRRLAEKPGGTRYERDFGHAGEFGNGRHLFCSNDRLLFTAHDSC